VILPGTNQTSSFICTGREGAVATHFTVDHGLGAIQKRYEKHGSAKETGEYSSLFNYEKDAPKKIPTLNDTAVNGAVEILKQADIIRPVARLKPLATLKGPNPGII
jgi:RNA-splicing ligase RtcB